MKMEEMIAVSVQEFVKKSSDPVVPPFYHVSDKEKVTPVVQAVDVFPSLPVIDMSRLASEGGEEEDELNKLHFACKEWGFFQVVNHGVSSSVVEKVKIEIHKFFTLPLEEKMEYRCRGEDIHEGYGRNRRPPIEERNLEWGDRFYMLINPVSRRKPYLLPQLPASFRDTLECYFDELGNMSKMLLGKMARVLTMEQKEMEDLFEDGMQSMRMNCYPPCPDSDLVMGLNSHTDGAAITILLEVNDVQGLQIYKDAHWIPIHFHPQAFVVNVGDILEILSNGMYRSVEHRVTINPKQERISIGVFYGPSMEAEIGPARSLLSPENQALFTRVGMEEYMENFFARKLEQRTNLEHMRILS